MPHKPLVFHIPKWYPNRYDPLLGVFVKRHILSTLPYTVPVVLYAMVSNDSRRWYECEECVEDGIVTYRIYYRKKITGINGIDKLVKLLLYFGLMMKVYYKARKKVGIPDVVNAHILLRTAVLAKWIEWKENRPYVLLEHSSQFIREEIKAFGPVSLLIARYVVRKASMVITVSECLAKGMKQRYGLENARYKVIYNTVDTTIFYQKNHQPQHAIKQLLYVAEFDDVSKNVSGLLHVIQRLSQKRNDFKVTMVGYGKDEKRLIDLSDSLGILHTSVSFVGKKSAHEVAGFLREADALLMFSNFETLSCIITEALCCGTPVITTAVGGIIEIVSNDNGRLVHKANQEEMLEAIEALLDGKLHWDTDLISSRARSLFSNESVGQQLLDVYQKVATC